MSIFSIVNAVLTFVIIFGAYYVAHRMIRNTQVREQSYIQQGIDVNVKILSMKQTGLFINNNPVVEMELRVVEPMNNKSWLIEKHKETVMLITLDAWQVGNTYQAKTDKDGKKIVFVRDDNDRPLLAN
ncbi:hypothetical protein [Kosakonia sp. MUSA4]|uniref:hypothetical protein n=1 Tax=Kosakonia sp. MUSA4 TaxID=2067958 RepID=UPI001598D6FC|nr:hypothetical protein [Kosakonia sp. MUSA4]QJT81164.1 hypothetical protein C0557_14310 [Kosakonia sp. MUSA4]